MRTEHASVCPLDCPDTCSLSVAVEDDRIVEVRGSLANPFTAGVICAKVARDFPAIANGEGRIMTPLRRTGARGEGKFERVSWDEALDIVHERVTAVMAAHGPQAVLPLNYAGPHGMLAGGSMDLRFFHKLGATLLDRKPLCGGIRTEAWLGTFGPVPGIPPEQAALSRLVIVWGNNVTWSNLHLMPVINRARRGGAKLVVVDPKRTKVAEQADLHLAPRPGTDVILAWSVTNELERLGGLDHDFIERHVEGFAAYMERVRRVSLADAERITGVPGSQIQALARWYHEASPAAISVGNGLERNQNGGSGIRAIFALPALAGKLGVPGGGLINGASLAFPKTAARLQRPDLAPAGTRTLNIVDVGAHLLDPALAPPIKALFIYNHNPVIVHPDQNRLRRGLGREDLFIVGADVVMTDSMAYCDVVLPAASHFEYADLYPAYGQHWLQRADPVIRPRGESLPNTEIFRRLAARFGFDDPAFRATDAELMDEAMDATDPRLGGLRPSELPVDRALPMTIRGEDAVLFKNLVPGTPSGKVELASSYLASKYDQLLPDYRPFESSFPLVLISPASDQRITSTFGGLKSSQGPPPLEMHPEDARGRGLRDGTPVRIWNDLGEIHLRVKITEALRPGVVSTLKGGWFSTSDNGQTVSALCPGHHADISGGACYNDTRVEVAAYAGDTR
jgi:anaerobic selenocysteine-containing dehydrogenase